METVSKTLRISRVHPTLWAYICAASYDTEFPETSVKTGLNYSEGIYLRRKAPSRSEERSCVVDWATAAPSGCTHGAGVWSQ